MDNSPRRLKPPNFSCDWCVKVGDIFSVIFYLKGSFWITVSNIISAFFYFLFSKWYLGIIIQLPVTGTYFYNEGTYFRINSIKMVRHLYNNKISYQWLNVETREQLYLVKMYVEQWRGSAAHILLKCLGPELFPKPVSCVDLYFSKFCLRAD